MEQEEQEVLVKWSGREFHFKLVPTTTISQLKLRIQVNVFCLYAPTLILIRKQEVSNVLPKNQKLTSASFKGKLPPEDVLFQINLLLQDLLLTNSLKATIASFSVKLKQILMIGTPEVLPHTIDFCFF